MLQVFLFTLSEQRDKSHDESKKYVNETAEGLKYHLKCTMESEPIIFPLLNEWPIK